MTENPHSTTEAIATAKDWTLGEMENFVRFNSMRMPLVLTGLPLTRER